MTGDQLVWLDMKSQDCLHCWIQEGRNQRKQQEPRSKNLRARHLFTIEGVHADSCMCTWSLHFAPDLQKNASSQVEATTTSWSSQNRSIPLLYIKVSRRSLQAAVQSLQYSVWPRSGSRLRFSLCAEPAPLLHLFIVGCVELLAAVQLAPLPSWLMGWEWDSEALNCPHVNQPINAVQSRITSALPIISPLCLWRYGGSSPPGRSMLHSRCPGHKEGWSMKWRKTKKKKKRRKVERASFLHFAFRVFLPARLIKGRLLAAAALPPQRKVSGAKLKINERCLFLFCTKEHLKSLMQGSLVGNMCLLFKSDAAVYHACLECRITSPFSTFTPHCERATVPPSVGEESGYKTNM